VSKLDASLLLLNLNNQAQQVEEELPTQDGITEDSLLPKVLMVNTLIIMPRFNQLKVIHHSRQIETQIITYLATTF